MSMAMARRLGKGSAGGGGIGQLIGNALGATVGFLVGGPPGAVAGAGIGGGVGGAAGGMVSKAAPPSVSAGAMERRQQPPMAGGDDGYQSHSPVLEESLKALKEIPEEFQAKYQEPLVQAYAKSFKEDRMRGLA